MTNPTPLRAVIFDWAGTLVDHGSRAPAAAFQQVFLDRGVRVSLAAARAPMGLAKRDHLAAMLAMEETRSAWLEVHGRPPSSDDLDALYTAFIALQRAILPQFADVIPGAVELTEALRAQGLALGSTTGYSRAMMEVLEPLAAEQGLRLDCSVCADEVPAGRPKPWMLFAAAQQLDAYPPRLVVNVDDTAAGVRAGRNAGMWSVGVTRTGNAIGLSLDETEALNEEALSQKLQAAQLELESAGAHFIVESVTELPAVLESIASLLTSKDKRTA